MALQAAERHYAYQQQVTAATVVATRRAWSRVSLADLLGSWRAVAPGLLALVTAAQIAAARDADPYIAAALVEQGATDDLAARVQPAAFAGIASDGRALDTLLALSISTVRDALAAGAAPAHALASGGAQLEKMTRTTVQDTGRAATTAGMIARPSVSGYVRVLEPPSCARCAILAGRVYRWSTGFERHENCDCRMLPGTVAAIEGEAVDPMAAFRNGQVRGLSKAEEAAISDGADLGQIVNAHREGAYQGLTTAEGVSRHGLAGRRLQGRQRLTVAGIQRIASDRAQAIELLQANAYIVRR